ncbi:MAG: hypothetical protein E7441_05815 [Ruminococcaceae bacterium]|nr:hypothetical protein [Oscillospiraceae bacterium]
MTLAEKCIEIGENNEAIAAKPPKVYAAGKNSMVDESKLLPTTVSGNYISLDDVSEIPHKVECKISGVADLTGVQITRTGKNLIDNSPENVKSGYYYDAGGSVATSNAGYIRISPIKVNPLTTYTLSTNLIIYTIWYFNADGAIKRESRSGLKTWEFTTPDNCNEIRISLHNTSGAADTVAFEYAQLEVGSTATKYEAYVQEQALTPNADGTVDGMISTSPYMNIFTDTEGVHIEVTYNKSWGMQETQERFYSDFQRGVINHSISFEWLTLSKESITSIVNALSDSATGQTITFKKSAKEAAFTDTEWTELIATKPNWTLALL